MFYTELPPHPALAAHVRCIWVFECAAMDGAGGEAAEPQRIVPDGYPEMVLHYGDRFAEIDEDGGLDTQSRFIFAGQISRPLVLQPGAAAGVIGVRLQPAGARAFIGMAMRETTDTRLDLTQVWARESRDLLDAVHGAKGVSARVDVVQRFLRRKLAQSRDEADAAIAYGVGLLRAANGRMTVDELAVQCGLSARQIERRFLREVGVSPRLLASIFRFRRVFDALEEAEASAATGRWVGAALSAGYFDQAHMIRDFKRFAGQRPQAFYRGLNGFSAAMVGGEVAAAR